MAHLFSIKCSKYFLKQMKPVLFNTSLGVRKKHANRNILKLHERGMFEDIFPENSSNEVLDLLSKSTQCVYAGFDPTASSLHIGNLLILTSLLHWQRGGHQVIALVGDATAMIGDPSGRTRDRDPQEKDRIQLQARGITSSIRKIFNNHEKYLWSKKENCDPLPPPIIVNNYSWYKEVNVIDFISNVGRNFRMGKMLLKESVAKRLQSERGMSFTEFTYQIFQAYDWLHLFRTHQCCFQIGGKDQMGNIVSGHNLIGRVEDKPVYGLTLPLITTDAGDKFGKSVPNAVWLDEKMTSPFDMYQFFIRMDDKDVERFLKLFTFETLGSINAIMQRHLDHPEKRIAQTKLAEDVTLLVHGDSGLKKAKCATSVLFANDISSLSKMDPAEVSTIFEGAPIVELILQPGYTVLQLAIAAKCFLHESDARRIIEAGGFYINYDRITNVDEVLVRSVHILSNNLSLVRVGKRNYYIIKWIA